MTLEEGGLDAEGDPDASLGRAAARGTLWSAVGSGGARVLSVGAFALLARMLAPADFGAFAFAAAAASLLQPFVGLGVGSALVRRRTLHPRTVDTAFLATAVAGLGTWLTLSAAALLVGSTSIGGAPIAVVVAALATVVPAALRTVPQALLQRALRFRALAAAGVTGVAAGALTAVAMGLAGCGRWSLVGQMLVEEWVTLGWTWRASGLRPRLRGARVIARPLLAFGGHVVGAEVVATAHGHVDALLAGLLLGPELTGYYAVARRAYTLVLDVVSRTLVGTAAPIFARIRGDRERLRAAVYGALEVAALAVCPLMLGLTAVAPELCRVFCGPGWGESARVLRLLGLLGPVVALTLFTSPLLVVGGQPRASFHLAALQAAANVAALRIGASWGLAGLTAATVARAYVLLPASLWFVRRVVDLDVARAGRALAGPLVAAAAMLGAVEAARRLLPRVADPGRFAILVLVGALAYAVALAAIAQGRGSRVPAVGRLLAAARGAARRVRRP